MAGEIIRPKDLTPRPAPVASELMVVDNSVNVGAATIKAIVEAGRPAASQAEAQAGTDPSKAMTPLTTKQSIAAEVGVSLASKSQGDLAATAVQPENLATVATSGAYADLSGKPVLGTSAATDASAYATSTQGGKADTALQSVVPGANVAIDNTDPRNPVVSASSGGGLGVAEDRAALKGMNTAAVTTVYLKETGREGQFVWKTGDYSSQIATDTLEGVFVKATATAANLGAWVRQFDGPVHASWFGASLQIAVNVAALLGKGLYLGEKGATFTITSTLTIPADLMVYSQLFGGAGAKIDASSGNFTALSLGAGAKLVGIELAGPGNNVYHVDSVGVMHSGSSNAGAAPTWAMDGLVENCFIHGFRNSGIELRYIRRTQVRFTRIEDCGYAGLMCISGQDVSAHQVRVKNIGPGTSLNAYGIAFTRFSGTYIESPVSERCRATECQVEDMQLWHAFDTHGGVDTVFEDCTSLRSPRGFIITATGDSTNGYRAAKRCSIVRCRAFGMTDRAKRDQGFWVTGAWNGATYADYAEYCQVMDSYFFQHGMDTAPGRRACGFLGGTRHLYISNLMIDQASGHGLQFEIDNLDFTVSGLSVVDWNSANGPVIAVLFTGENNKGRLLDYKFLRLNTGLAANVGNIGFNTAAGLATLVFSTSHGRNIATTATSYGTTPTAYDF